MQKVFILLTAVVLLGFALPSCAETIQTTTVASLVEKATQVDGQAVELTLEAIGDRMRRGDHFWVNGLDSSGAIGLWVSAADGNKVTLFGDSKHIGDIIRITGVFHRACVEHGGDLDIHVNKLEVIGNGYETERKMPGWKIDSMVILAMIAGTTGIVWVRSIR